MRLKQLELTGFKSFAKKTTFTFEAPVTAIVGPNGSGKSNCAEAFRWVLGERSMKALRGGRGEDLIWNGPSTGSGQVRTNRASATLVFDNRDRKFDLDFDEVTITREVYRDGQNVYLINGSAVRQRDILELLANVSLGSSDHYIVNQGDADRILRANPRERRALVEDALGLRVYQWKIEESRKKLEQTEENKKQVESLRRELAPHLKYLKKQLEKIEQTDQWRRELKQLYLEYLKREEIYLTETRRALEGERAAPAEELRTIEARLVALAPAPSGAPAGAAGTRLALVDEELGVLAERRDEFLRRLGRLEGALEVREEEEKRRAELAERDFSAGEVGEWVGRLEAELAQAERLTDLFSIKSAITRLRGWVGQILQRGRPAAREESSAMTDIKHEIDDINKELGALRQKEEVLVAERGELRQQTRREVDAAHEAERETYELKARQGELRGRLAALEAREEKWRLEEEAFRREIEEGVVLVDHEIRRYAELAARDLPTEGRAAQEERHRQLEKLKIRLEDLGGDTGDTRQEFQDASNRDEYLAREIADLEQSASSLNQIIADLEQKIAQEFERGLAKINEQFQDFFALMFGGGGASLKITRPPKLQADLETEFPSEDEEVKAGGLDINVSLPRKKIRGLEMLSGGERALTSIALLFAMSQVNPPPFLILDETDAALDEANSRKYGEMVANLAKHSQLVLITHNRETMSRADLIYGITMGADGVSKQLSIKFDDAAAYAK